MADGVNPLRPYYIPPRIGAQTESLPRANPFSNSTAGAATTASAKYASKARDIFPDIDYKEHLDELSPSTIESVKQFIDELLWKYTSVLMAQPFEVAKTILQARIQDDLGALHVAPVEVEVVRPSIASPKDSVYDEAESPTTKRGDADVLRSLPGFQFPDSDSDPDEPAYFTSSAPYTPTPSARPRRRRGSSPPVELPKINTKPTPPPHQIVLRRPDSILEVIAQLWSKESAWGVWKGTNATFLYSILQSLLENWGRSLLSALLNVPDLGVKDDVDRLVEIASPYPWASLCVAAAAAVTTGLILAPLDLIRTRLIVTSTSRAPRRTVATLRSLPSWVCHSTLVAPTILHSLIHPFLTLSMPLVLRSQFLIDRDISPMTFSVVKFCTSCASLFVKLPLETVLRRGQMAVLAEPSYLEALDKSGKMDTVVQPGPYNGVVGTMYTIVSEEGSRAITVPVKNTHRGRKGKTKASEAVYKKGQGLDGLWRGWKVSWWGLVGLWTASIAGAGGEGEF
ncbi:putative mitochondrial carrier domain protein [Rosellinia necatrix]|uniref:Putative mitochondrial carrier domain protein n=1 Tax=Rosellinia necatrix TaxID=77044 RepID=A0A1W2TWJ0_ROSNE|nr:putative mitochondrial carrier domain protein [Rosellinia necatrix]